ncbi:hypothetical protein ACF08N_16330 [Streptomyces sp. NPDC015127]|uniref:hypothetical protein n=1 Tax=Streptomyces sp. NPDC015127 TaxID=3364939 RepID=UPI0037007C52
MRRAAVAQITSFSRLRPRAPAAWCALPEPGGRTPRKAACDRRAGRREDARALAAPPDGGAASVGRAESGYDRSDAEGWHDGARELADTLTDLRHARAWTRESYRLNPGHRLRRAGPALPSEDLDVAWGRIVHHLIVLTRLLVAATGGQPSLRPLPGFALEPLSDVLHGAADLCLPEADADGTAEHAAPPTGAWEAHNRLKSLVLTHNRETATSLGGLIAETQQLLYALGPGSERN